MSDKAFFEQLRAQWNEGSAGNERVAASYAAHRRWLGLSIIRAVICILLLVLCAGWLGYLTWQNQNLMFAVGAAAISAGVPLLTIALLRLMKASYEDERDGPSATLQRLRAQAVLKRSNVRNGRWAAIALCVATVAAVVAAPLDRTPLRIVWPILVLWIGTALIAELWQRRTARRLDIEIARCDELLAIYKAAEAGD